MAAKELKYGAKYPCWAPITTEGAGVLPTYGTGIVMSELSKVVEAINFAEAEAYYDDTLSEEISEFRSGTATVDHKGMEDTTLELVYGSKITGGVLEDAATDNPGLGGFAFYTKIRDGGVTSYRTVHYPKVKAKITGETYDTKGSAITLAGGQTTFTIFQADNGVWRRRKRYTTEADAELWVKNAVGVAVAYEVNIATSGTINVSPLGSKMVATGGNLAIAVGVPTAVYDNGVDVTSSVAAQTYTLTNVLANHNIVVIKT
jgi:hypothetical protein